MRPESAHQPPDPVAGPADVLVDNYLALMDDSVVAILPHALRITAELEVADALAGGPRPVGELATLVGADPGSLYRLLRALAGVGFFVESADRTFGLTDRGDRLRSDGPRSLRESLLNLDSCRTWHAGADSIRSGGPVFPRLLGGTFFDHKDTGTAANLAFLRRMRERAARLYPAVVDAVDWAATSVLMDVGGGDGYLLTRILRRAPHLAGVLFDRPAAIEVVQGSDELGAVADRCRLVGGNFFDSLPGGADTHLMCSVLHDWTDEEATSILRTSRGALRAGGRVLVVEMVLPAGDPRHPGSWSDLGMMILTGGRERTEAELAGLLAGAGFGPPTVTPVAGSFFSVLEAR